MSLFFNVKRNIIPYINSLNQGKIILGYKYGLFGGELMKKIVSSILITLILIAIPSFAYAKDPKDDIFKLDCKSALLMEYSTGKIIHEYKAHEKTMPASVTKIMTMLIAMEAVDSGQSKLTDKVVASERAKSMGGSTMYLEVGEIRTVEELLKAVGIESANDAAVALAEHFGGTEEAFVIKMNERAKALGMKNTNFANCTGFYNENHYTSAYDVAIMSRELIKHSKILEYTSIWMEPIVEGRKEPFTLTNRNKLVKHYPGCDGLKTGFITESKYCISATAKRGDIRFISVIMGAPTFKIRNAQASKLMDYGFAKYESKKIVTRGESLGEIKIPKSKPERVNIYASDNLSVVYEKGSKINPEKILDINNNINLPLKKGDTVGKLKAVEGEKSYGEVGILVDQDVFKMNLGDTICKGFRYWLNIK